MDECLDLPPGFRFHPTDEEIITHYLTPKVVNSAFAARAIGEVDLNKCEPWDLPSKAKMGEKEWYFFCQRDRKYPTGMRTNRATESGYWKATGKDKEIFRGRSSAPASLVGMKKTLVFYRGRAPKGDKSNWVMHEYRLEGKSSSSSHQLHTRSNSSTSSKDEWVVCRVFHKSTGSAKRCLTAMTMMPSSSSSHELLVRMNSFGNLLLDSPNLPPLLDSAASPSYFNNHNNANANNDMDSCSFDLKGTLVNSGMPMPVPVPSSSSSSYYLNLMGFDDNNNFNNSNTHPNLYRSVQLAPLVKNNWMGYMQQKSRQQQHQVDCESGQIMRQCKVEQHPNHSIVSDDTGLSTDHNTEISSVLSRHDINGGSCTSYDGAATEAGLDLDSMWN